MTSLSRGDGTERAEAQRSRGASSVSAATSPLHTRRTVYCDVAATDLR